MGRFNLRMRGGAGATPGSDTIPDAIVFEDNLAAALDTDIIVRATLSGTNANASMTVLSTSTSYSINGGTYATSLPVDVPPGATIDLKRHSSSSNSTSTNVGCTIGGVASSGGTITTVAADGGYPDAVASPASGTALTAVWDLQTSGTGPRTSATNGTWSGAIDDYLSSVGFVDSNHDGALYLDAGTSDITVSNYDFTNAPELDLNGTTGSITFADCLLVNLTKRFGASIHMPCTINGDVNTTTGTLVVNFDFCTFDVTVIYVGSGTANLTNCKATNQVQQVIDGSTGANISLLRCFIPGGGCNPVSGVHVELCQYGATDGKSMTIDQCMIDCHGNGQAELGVALPDNYGWTGVFTDVGTGSMEISNTIFIGIDEVNANPLNPDRIACCVQYSDDSPITITNCILQFGSVGYTANGHGSAGRPIDGGGNRSFANVALTVADWN